MKTITLDGRKMKSREKVHEYLKLKLSKKGYMGNNLDALWDMLSTYDQEIKIKLIYGDYLVENLEDYGEKILKLFLDAAKDNDRITLDIES